jgi:hypothetical protein
MDQERTGSGRTRPADFFGRLCQNLSKQGQLVTEIVKKSRHPTLLDAVPKKVRKNWKNVDGSRTDWVRSNPTCGLLWTIVSKPLKATAAGDRNRQKITASNMGAFFLIGIPFRQRKQGVRSRRVWTEKTKVMTVGAFVYWKSWSSWKCWKSWISDVHHFSWKCWKSWIIDDGFVIGIFRQSSLKRTSACA